MKTQTLQCRTCHKRDRVEVKGPPQTDVTYVCERCAPGQKK